MRRIPRMSQPRAFVKWLCLAVVAYAGMQAVQPVPESNESAWHYMLWRLTLDDPAAEVAIKLCYPRAAREHGRIDWAFIKTCYLERLGHGDGN